MSLSLATLSGFLAVASVLLFNHHAAQSFCVLLYMNLFHNDHKPQKLQSLRINPSQKPIITLTIEPITQSTRSFQLSGYSLVVDCSWFNPYVLLVAPLRTQSVNNNLTSAQGTRGPQLVSLWIFALPIKPTLNSSSPHLFCMSWYYRAPTGLLAMDVLGEMVFFN
jgi:hypothetical protein